MKLHVEKWFGKCSGNDNTGSCFLHEMCWNASRLIFFSMRKTGGKMSLLWSKRSSDMICSLWAPISEHVHFGQTLSLINSSLHIPRYLVMEDCLTTLSTPRSLTISPRLCQPEHTQRSTRLTLTLTTKSIVVISRHVILSGEGRSICFVTDAEVHVWIDTS